MSEPEVEDAFDFFRGFADDFFKPGEEHIAKLGGVAGFLAAFVGEEGLEGEDFEMIAFHLEVDDRVRRFFWGGFARFGHGLLWAVVFRMCDYLYGAGITIHESRFSGQVYRHHDVEEAGAAAEEAGLVGSFHFEGHGFLVGDFEGVEKIGGVEADFDGFAGVLDGKVNFCFAHFRGAGGDRECAIGKCEADAFGFFVGEQRGTADGGEEAFAVKRDLFVGILWDHIAIRGKGAFDEGAGHRRRDSAGLGRDLDKELVFLELEGNNLFGVGEEAFDQVDRLDWHNGGEILAGIGSLGDRVILGLSKAVAVGGDQQKFFALLFEEDAVDCVTSHFPSSGEAGAVEEESQCSGGKGEVGGPFEGGDGGKFLGVVTEDFVVGVGAFNECGVGIGIEGEGVVGGVVDDFGELAGGYEGDAGRGDIDLRKGVLEGDFHIGGDESERFGGPRPSRTRSGAGDEFDAGKDGFGRA